MIVHIILLLIFHKTLAIMAFALVPSQVPGAKTYVRGNDKDVDGDSNAGDEVVYIPQPQVSAATLATSSSVSSSSSTKERRNNKKRSYHTIPRTGNLPDVHWRAISMSHLRSHPNFQPLPPPSMIETLPTKEDVRYFRQESWQWDYLHTGRCTTSQSSAALGFLEPKAATFLGIPKSLQRGGVGAWNRLRQEVPDEEKSLFAMEQILCEGRSSSPNAMGIEDVVGWRPGIKESDRLWIPASKLSGARAKPFPFSAKYMPILSYDELYQRKLYLQQNHITPSPMSTRMQWGNAQEATSVLTALNYFCGVDNRTMIHEVGMCGAKFDDVEDDLLQGLKIGATPDALIHHADGTVEVLEVKNHCPFVWNKQSPHFNGNSTKSRPGVHSSSTRKKNKGKKRHKKSTKNNGDDQQQQQNRGGGLPKHYLIRDFQLERRIPPAYLPQLMMEILCAGDECKAATMVRQTATKGAILLRVKRCESWITEMKYWLGRFQSEYVNTGIIPDDNFFWSGDKDSRYGKFLQSTKELSESVEQVAYIDHARIQRMMLESKDEMPLFLDNIYHEMTEESL